MERERVLVTGDIALLSSEADRTKRPLTFFLIKRAFDEAVSIAGLILLSPLLLVTACLILLEDGGPVFFVQNRIGKNCKEFKMYKFRSMKKNAAEIHEQLKEQYGCQDVSFKLQKDPRVTKVGGFIRKFNIDELPQLLNILKGDMSFVGPRPLPVYEYEDEQKLYGKTYWERYLVPQGLTCTWQISRRASVDFEQRMQMDVEYARTKSLWLDLKLILKTFVFTIIGKAAYKGEEK